MKLSLLFVGGSALFAAGFVACATSDPEAEVAVDAAAPPVAPDGPVATADAQRDAPADRDTSLKASDLVEAMVQRACTTLRDTCSGLRTPIDTSKCRKSPPLARLAELAAIAGSKNIEIDPGGAPADCLTVIEAWAKASFGTTTLVDRNLDVACLSLFRGKLALGATGCTSAIECVDGFCDLSTGTGTCRPLRAQGESCSDPRRTNEPCARLGIRGADFYCGGQTATSCILTKPYAAPCAYDHECLTGTCGPCGSSGPCEAGAPSCIFERTEPAPCERYSPSTSDAGPSDAGADG